MKYRPTAYDASYLWLARHLNAPLVTLYATMPRALDLDDQVHDDAKVRFTSSALLSATGRSPQPAKET